MNYLIVKKKNGTFDLLNKDTKEILGNFKTREETKAAIPKKKTGPKPKPLTVNERQAIKNFAENGGKMGKAMIDAGLSEKKARDPGRFFNRPAVISEYVKILDEAGLSDPFLAQTHRELATASILREFEFPNRVKEVIVDVEDEEGNTKKQIEKQYEPVRDEEIKVIIESMAGCKLVQVIDHYTKKIAYYTAPVHTARNEALKTAYKNKGHFAPEHISLDTHHELTPEEQKELDKILQNND